MMVILFALCSPPKVIYQSDFFFPQERQVNSPFYVAQTVNSGLKNSFRLGIVSCGDTCVKQHAQQSKLLNGRDFKIDFRRKHLESYQTVIKQRTWLNIRREVKRPTVIHNSTWFWLRKNLQRLEKMQQCVTGDPFSFPKLRNFCWLLLKDACSSRAAGPFVQYTLPMGVWCSKASESHLRPDLNAFLLRRAIKTPFL